MLVTVLLPGAYAASPAARVHGGFDFVFTSQNVTKVVGGNTFIDFTFSNTLNGSVIGSHTGTGTLIAHANGTVSIRDLGTFNGTLFGVSTTCGLKVAASGTLAAFTGNVVINGCTGAVSGVTVIGQISGSARSATTLVGSYAGRAF